MQHSISLCKARWISVFPDSSIGTSITKRSESSQSCNGDLTWPMVGCTGSRLFSSSANSEFNAFSLLLGAKTERVGFATLRCTLCSVAARVRIGSPSACRLPEMSGPSACRLSSFSGHHWKGEGRPGGPDSFSTGLSSSFVSNVSVSSSFFMP